MNLRVMVVDDSALYRQLVKNVLRDVPDVEVVALAKTGAEALQLLAEAKPDLLTLDVQMPDMNGLELLRELRKNRSCVKAIMLSSLTAQGAQVTTDALLAGAFDFIQKPNSPDANANRSALCVALREKVSAFRESQMPRAPKAASSKQPVEMTSMLETSSRNPSKLASYDDLGVSPKTGVHSIAAPSSTASPSSSKKIRAILIGTSTGGPVALREVLPKLPSTLNVPVFVVQHMPARYTKSLAARLAETSLIPIVEAADGMLAEPNNIYIAPGGLHMKLASNPSGQCMIQTTEDPPEHNCRPSVDYLFRSAADYFDGQVLAVIMTGMGRDGTEGCRLIKQQGGTVIAQHPDGCIVYGMPRVVIEEHLADRVVPLEKISSWIVRMVESKT